MRIIVTGGRDYDDHQRVYDVLMECAYEYGTALTIVHGGAHGADLLAAHHADRLNFKTESHPADWDAHGRAAGMIRNEEMIQSGADLVIAFPGGKGTADCVRRAVRAGIPVRRIAEREQLRREVRVPVRVSLPYEKSAE